MVRLRDINGSLKQKVAENRIPEIETTQISNKTENSKWNISKYKLRMELVTKGKQNSN